MTDQLRTITDAQRHAPPTTYDDLCALMLNCTLTRSPKPSHAEGLLRIAKGIYRAKGVKTEMLRPVDDEIPAGLGEGSGGLQNDFTHGNTTFLDWITVHVARWLEDAGGVPPRGTQP